MKLSHLLADAIRNEREATIAGRRLATLSASMRTPGISAATRPERWIARLLPAR